MQKTFCDRCGRECTNYVLHLAGHVIHKTNRAEVVGEDEFKPNEYCKECSDMLVKLFNLRTYPRHDHDTIDSDTAMVATAPPLSHQDAEPALRDTPQMAPYIEREALRARGELPRD